MPHWKRSEAVEAGAQVIAMTEGVGFSKQRSGQESRPFGLFTACVVASLLAAGTARTAAPGVGRILRNVGNVYSHLQDYHIVATRDSSFLQSHTGFSRHSKISLDGGRRGRVRMKLTGDGPDVVVASDGKTTWQYAPGKNQYTERAGPALTEERAAQGRGPGRDAVFRQVHDLLVGRFAGLGQWEKNATFEGEQEIKYEGRQVLCYQIVIKLKDLTDQLWIDPSSYVVLQEKKIRPPASSGSRTLVMDNIRIVKFNTHAAHSPEFFAFTPPADAWRVVALDLAGKGEGVVGTSAGDFTLNDVEGNPVRLSDFRGRTVLLNFWATWCMPCNRELPTLQKILDERKDVVVLAVDDENAATVRNFLKEKHYNFPALMDRQRTLFKKFAVHFIPTVLVIDREGVIVREIVGWEGPQKLLAALKASGN